MRLMTGSLVLAAATVSLLCASVGGAQAVTARYRCSDGSRLIANFSPPTTSLGSVVLQDSDGWQVTLPQLPSADGGRYGHGTTQFWIKGRGATYTRGGQNTTCQS